jgi:hypothetical protein
MRRKGVQFGFRCVIQQKRRRMPFLGADVGDFTQEKALWKR